MEYPDALLGLMDRVARQLDIRVPDSADGELAGLRGRMEIRIEAVGGHFYDYRVRSAGGVSLAAE